MYTRCPHCLTVFVVAAEQLKAAHGNVRCGTCLESFDAIPHLSDGPPQDAAPDPVAADAPGEAPASVDDGPGPAIDQAPVTPVDPPHPAPAAPGNDAAGPPRSAAEQLSSTLDALRADDGARRSGEAEETDPGASEDDAPAGGHAARRVAVLDPPPGGDGAADDAALPEVLRHEVDELAARTASRRRTVAFGIAALGLLALLGVQYVFFMPEDAARRYPQWRAAIESLCIRVGCVLPERRDPGRIRVVSRDVRVHPKIEGVMQIKATLTNTAPFRQPYPLMRFTLFNVNGQTIATRDFTPSEYLGRPVAESARLRPKAPFQVELDVLAPEEAAVSFEFSFL